MIKYSHILTNGLHKTHTSTLVPYPDFSRLRPLVVCSCFYSTMSTAHHILSPLHKFNTFKCWFPKNPIPIADFRKDRRRTRLLNQIKKSAGVIKSSLPKIKDVNVIDKYSRVVFPVSFILFNVAYWCFYVMDTDGRDTFYFWIYMEILTAKFFMNFVKCYGIQEYNEAMCTFGTMETLFHF